MKNQKYYGLLLLAMASANLFACTISVMAGEHPKIPSEAELQTSSTLVFQGKLVAKDIEPGATRASSGPQKHTFLVTQWIKGFDKSGKVTVSDQLGTTCDRLEGRYHIMDADTPEAVEWRIFAKKRGDDYWVISAHRLDKNWQ